MKMGIYILSKMLNLKGDLLDTHLLQLSRSGINLSTAINRNSKLKLDDERRIEVEK